MLIQEVVLCNIYVYISLSLSLGVDGVLRNPSSAMTIVVITTGVRPGLHIAYTPITMLDC